MANLVTYAKQKWEDAKTAITAARLNNMEDGIGNCAAQINALGDSVSQVEGLVVVEEQINPDESISDYLSRVWSTLPMSKPVVVHSRIGVRAQAQLILAYRANAKSGMALRLSYDTKTVTTRYRFFDGEWTTI